jgi:hypothetical protein
MAVIYGVDISNNDVASKTQKVLNISLAILVLVIVQGIATEVVHTNNRSQQVDAVLARILIGLMLPIIGYMGARLRNRTLIGCFAGCNVCGICFFLVTLMVLFSGLGHLGEWQETCEQRAAAEGVSNVSCGFIRSKYMKLLAANLVFGGTAFIFNVLGCIWGWQLFEHQYYNKGGGGGSFGSGAPSGWYDV